MNEYHKIQTLWLRDPETKHKTLLEGQWALPEFEYLQHNEWIFTEKVDGTNIRVMWDGESVTFGGRTDNAQIPAHLVNKLQELFPAEKMAAVLKGPVTLYGEGYGAKIQKGGGDYISNGCSFILFDVRAGGFWLERDTVEDIADQLGIHHVPVLGTGDLEKAVDWVRDGFDSHLKDTPPEGLVLRPSVELVARNGRRVIGKLKLKDFAR